MHRSEVAAQEYCEYVQNRARSKGPTRSHECPGSNPDFTPGVVVMTQQSQGLGSSLASPWSGELQYPRQTHFMTQRIGDLRGKREML